MAGKFLDNEAFGHKLKSHYVVGRFCTVLFQNDYPLVFGYAEEKRGLGPYRTKNLE